jgi:hypothetical protein
MIPIQNAPVFPPGRYGRRRDPFYQRKRRWVTWIMGALVIALSVAIAVKLYRQYVEAPYEVTIINIRDITDTGVTVTFDVTVPQGGSATCTVQGHTRDGRLVGRAEVDAVAADAAQTTIRVTYSLATTARPVTGEVPGCGPLR